MRLEEVISFFERAKAENRVFDLGGGLRGRVKSMIHFTM